MGNGEDGPAESKDEIIQIFLDFMTRIAKLEELASVGSKLLVGFQQALGFIGQHPISKTSPLIERIIKAHDTERVRSYVDAGCMNHNDSAENVRKSKEVVDELECLVDNATSAVETASRKDEDVDYDLDSFTNSSDEEEISFSDQSKPGVAEYAAMMAIIYDMVKEDYTMQARIVSSLEPHVSLESLETYCQMWSLRPFIDDEIMHEAWRFVP